MGRAVVFGLIILIGLCVFAYTTYAPSRDHEENPADTAREAPASFAWTFEEDGTLNPDGQPQTSVSLRATYPDGQVRDTRVDTVPGGCSVLPDPEEGSLAGTSAAQCYYAGLGYRYRIVAEGAMYRVERKRFEEASPEHVPPQQAYEALIELP